MFILPNNATIIEVGPRDGLQNEKKHVEEIVKLDFIHRLQAAGIKRNGVNFLRFTEMGASNGRCKKHCRKNGKTWTPNRFSAE